VVYGVSYIYYQKKKEKAKPSREEKKRGKKSFLKNNNNNNKSGIVYFAYVEVAQAWYKGATIDGELLDHEFSGSY